MGRKVALTPEKPRITVSGIRLPDPIPDGEILIDTKNGQWKIGRSIGFGGFGEIYLASKHTNNFYGARHDESNSKYVIKVEPHSSSTLFVEMNFYLRVATREKVNEWKEHYNQKVLGMPHIENFGSHFFHEKLRFLVLPRYGCDVQKKFYEFGRRFHPKTAFTLCYYIIDILEYIHSHGYVHNDIKASNLVLGLPGRAQAPVYLVDFGLACRYIDNHTGLHKPYCEDERRAHNGTLEFTSRDGHCGALSRKGDLEILGYNLLQWLVGYLPWEMDLSDPDRVATLKKRAMGHINDFVSRCYNRDSPPVALIDYLKYINSLQFDTTPDYKYIKKLFRLGVQQSGYRFDKVLSFDSHGLPLIKEKSIKRLQCEIENIVEESPRKLFIVKNSIKTPELRIPCNVQDNNRITRQSVTESQIKTNKKFDWVKVLQSNPDKKFANLKKKERPICEKVCDNLASCDELINALKMNNPTYAMLEQMRKMRKRQLAEQNQNDVTIESDEVNNNSKSRRKSKHKSKRNIISQVTSPKKLRYRSSHPKSPAESPPTKSRVNRKLHDSPILPSVEMKKENRKKVSPDEKTVEAKKKSIEVKQEMGDTKKKKVKSKEEDEEWSPRKPVKRARSMKEKKSPLHKVSKAEPPVSSSPLRRPGRPKRLKYSSPATKSTLSELNKKLSKAEPPVSSSPVRRPGRPKRLKYSSPATKSTLSELNKKLMYVLNKMAISGVTFKLNDLKELDAPRVHRSDSLKRINVTALKMVK